MFDHNKPIIVHAGQDTFENIGTYSINSIVNSTIFKIFY